MMRTVARLFALSHLCGAFVGLKWRLWYWRMKGADIGERVYLSPGFKILGSAANISIGRGSSIGIATLHGHAPLTVGPNVIVNDRTELMTGSHDPASPQFALVAQAISVGERAWIATGALVLPGANIGERAIVAAGSVVLGPVSAGEIVAGNPARVVGRRPPADFNYEPFMLHPVSRFWRWRDTRRGGA